MWFFFFFLLFFIFLTFFLTFFHFLKLFFHFFSLFNFFYIRDKTNPSRDKKLPVPLGMGLQFFVAYFVSFVFLFFSGNVFCFFYFVHQFLRPSSFLFFFLSLFSFFRYSFPQFSVFVFRSPFLFHSFSPAFRCP